MKDWRTWVLLIGAIFLFKMCGGCDESDSPSGIDTDALEIRLIGKYQIRLPHITSVEKVNDDPPTFKFEYDYEDELGIRQHRTGHCTLYEDGNFKDIY